MAIRFACPTCHKHLSVTEDHAGKRVKCPGCLTVLGVPQLPANAPRASVPAVSNPVLPPPLPNPAIEPLHPAASAHPAPTPAIAPVQTVPSQFRRVSAGSVPKQIGRELPSFNPPFSRAAVWKWLAGATACLLLISGVVLTIVILNSSGNDKDKDEVASAKDNNEKKGSDTAAGKGKKDHTDSVKKKLVGKEDQPAKDEIKAKDDSDSPPPKPVNISVSELQNQVAKGLRVKGSILFDTRIEIGYNTRTTYHQWKPNIQLVNDTQLSMVLGGDMFLLEVNSPGTTHEGVGIFHDQQPSTKTNHSTYGLLFTYEVRGKTGLVSINLMALGYFSFRSGGKASADFGRIPPGKSWNLTRIFEQMTWLRDDLRASLKLIFPEVRVRTTKGWERFRVIAYFKKPDGYNRKWELARQEIIPMQLEKIQDLLASPKNNQSTKVLAANWLVNLYPDQSVKSLVRLGKTVNEGQLCATCLELLTALKGEGLGEHAIELLKTKYRPNWIRRMAAVYMGATKYHKGLDAVLAATEDTDNTVASGAIVALGNYAGPKAIKKLLGLLDDNHHQTRHLLIAENLLKTKDASAIQSVQDLASKGNTNALEALAFTGLPETFPFFVKMLGEVKNQAQRDKVARGLRKAGGDKALPELLKLLAKDDPPPVYSPLQNSETVRQIMDLNSPKATATLVELAQKAHLRAWQTLAGSKNKSILDPLTKLTQSATGPALQIGLSGLQTNWAKDSVAVFAKYLDHADLTVVRSAMQGLQNSKDAKAPAVLVSLLKHKDPGIRSGGAYALTSFDLSKEREVVKALKELALAGEKEAGEALIRAKLKDAYEFFVQLAGRAKNAPERSLAARGLFASGGEKSVAELVKLLEKEDPPPAFSPLYSYSEVGNQLIALNSAKATPLLVDLANKGNLRALQVLAGCKNSSVRDPLIELAKKANTVPALQIALQGLQTNWPKHGVPVFAKNLDHADLQVVRSALTGLQYSKDSSAPELLVTLLKHKDAGIRSSAGYALSNFSLAKSPAAVQTLKDLALQGNKEAGEAIVFAKLPETFEFFVKLAGQAKDQPQRGLAARGLYASGGVKAVTELIRLLEKEDPPPAYSALYSYSEVGNQLVLLNSAKATPPLVALAKKGNLRALQVLATCKNTSVRDPLVDLAQNANNLSAIKIALHGLQNNWPRDGVSVFAKFLSHGDKTVVQSALTGLQNSKSPKAASLVVPLLKHTDPGIRSSAAYALGSLPLDDVAGKLADTLVESTDDGLISPLTNALIRAQWKDKKFARKLGERLSRMKGFGQYDLIRLLRQVSGDAMGPRDSNEYYRDTKGWIAKWVAWAEKN